MLVQRIFIGIVLVFLIFLYTPCVSISDQENMMSETNSRPNRLIHEKSPYLLQHAYNPVDWYPWGDEAVEKSKAENKPILLSIGYSTCHWCHVMEKESFMDPKIAELMNHNFVCIKLDREERPDLDKIYITFETYFRSLERSFKKEKIALFRSGIIKDYNKSPVMVFEPWTH